MRIAAILGLVLALIAGLTVSAMAELDEAGQKLLKNVNAHVTKGEAQLEKETKAKSNASKLRTLDRALYFLRRATKLSDGRKEPEFEAPRKTARSKEIEALNRQATIYFQRKSLKKAEEKLADVFKLDKDNALAKATQKLIDDERKGDLLDDPDLGKTAIDRIRARRRAAGIPLRDRGRARRR